MSFPDHLRRGIQFAAIGTATALTVAACASTSDDSSPDAKKNVSKVTVTLTGGAEDTCKLSATEAKAGPITFTVTNKSSTAITEVELLDDQKIIGEKENLAPGLAPVSFTNTLDGGTYQIYCPGAKKELVDFKVTGKAAATSNSSASQLLQQGSTEYGKYVTDQIGQMLTATTKLQSDIDAGNLDAAKKDYAQARPFYERVESDVDGFVKDGYKATDNAGNLDYLVDMRESNLDPKVGWHGFHAIERDLWEKGAITDDTKKLAAELTENIGLLKDKAPSLTYKPEDLANGAAGLLEEVQTNKITGEEEAYSHIDLVDLAANVEGASQAFAYLKPGLEKLNQALTEQISTQITKTNALLDTFRDPSALGGYKEWTGATKSDNARAISQQVQALQDPLSKIATEVASA